MDVHEQLQAERERSHYYKCMWQEAKDALMAERERCAKIAEADCRTALAIEHDYKPTWYVRAQEIAAAIRIGNRRA